MTGRTQVQVDRTGEWKKLYNEELHDSHTSSNFIRVTKSRRMRLVRPAACIAEKTSDAKFWWGRQKERGD
jgi:hypothetical protein